MTILEFCEMLADELTERHQADPDMTQADADRFISEGITGSEYYFKPHKRREILADCEKTTDHPADLFFSIVSDHLWVTWNELQEGRDNE